ncbi:MAG: enoyl-CoA hydratase-related protein [Kiloniellales bacterium]
MANPGDPAIPDSASPAEPILVARDDTIVTVTLNRPDKLNALDRTSWQRLGTIMGALDEDDSLRCIVLRGAGDKAFAAGADISAFERERADVAQARAYGETVQAAMGAVAACGHPTVALIKGVCVGGGLELACCCDMRICGESSRFGVPVGRLGLTMAYGELKMLLQLVGPAAAREILLEGRVFDARHAWRMGLVNRVVADAEVEAETYACAGRIAEGAPLVAGWHKKFIDRLGDPRPLEAHEIEEGYASMATEDYKIGVRAFLQKKQPKFTGR